jgi:hypothetical protein
MSSAVDLNTNETFCVEPQIARFNGYVQQVKSVAVVAVNPLHTADLARPSGFKVRVEGPAQHVSHLRRLLASHNILQEAS